MKAPFLATYIEPHPQAGKVILLITDNSYNLWEGVYLSGENKGVYSKGLNNQFFVPYDGKIEIDNTIFK